MPSLTPADFQRLVEVNDGDEALARKLMAQRGYTIEGEDVPVDEEQDGSDLGVAPGGNLAALQGVLSGQRQSIGDLYDTITQNIQKRYRAPDINDMLIAIGTGMMSAPGEGDAGGFGGAVQRGLRGIGTYAAQKSAYDADMNKMMSQVEIQRAKDLADLEGRYVTGAASLLKPTKAPDPYAGAQWDATKGIWVPRPGSGAQPVAVGTKVVNGLERTIYSDGSFTIPTAGGVARYDNQGHLISGQ